MSDYKPKPPKTVTFKELLDHYFELGKEGYALLRRAGHETNESAAVFAAQAVIRGYLHDMSKDAGKLDEFNAAEDNYARIIADFHDPASPIAQIIDQVNSTQTGEIPQKQANENIVNILANPEMMERALVILRRHENAPTAGLLAIKSIIEEMKSLPKNAVFIPEPARPNDIPDYVPKPKPVLGLPVPAHAAELKPLPEPFSRQKFIKQKVQETAERIQQITGVEVGMIGAGFGVAVMLGHPLVGVVGSILFLASKIGVGRLLELPGVQDWIAKEPNSSGK